MNASQAKFIRELATFLVGNEVEMSIKLQMKKEDAIRWSNLRGATPLFGYYSGEEGIKEAEEELVRFLELNKEE